MYNNQIVKVRDIMNKLSKEFSAPCYDFDYLMNFKPSSILNYFQEIAGEHANLLKVGKEELSPNGVYWVLSKISVNFYNKMQYGNALKLITAPRPKNRIICEREYLLTDNKGNKIADGISKWCLIDKNTKKILSTNIMEYNIDIYENLAIKSSIETFNINMPFEFCYSYTAGYNDLDFNGHVNNAKYADYIFNAIDLSVYDNKKIKSFQINYLKEWFAGNTLNFCKNKIDDNNYIVVGKNQNNEVVVSAKIEFDEL